MAKCGGGGCSCIVVVKVAALGGREAAAGFFLFPANLRAHQTLVLRCSFSQSARAARGGEGGVRLLRRARSFFTFLFRSFRPSVVLLNWGKTSRQPPSPQPPLSPLSLSRHRQTRRRRGIDDDDCSLIFLVSTLYFATERLRGSGVA